MVDDVPAARREARRTLLIAGAAVLAFVLLLVVGRLPPGPDVGTVSVVLSIRGPVDNTSTRPTAL